MAKSVQKVTLTPSQDIPFDKLVLSQSNVWRTKAGISVEELAEDIGRRGLLQSLSVRPIMADDGSETGKFEIPAGGRRIQTLSLLVKQKRLAKTTPIPCIVRDANSTILAEDDSLAENCSALPCIRSISSAPSWRLRRRVRATKRSQPPSSLRHKWSNSV